MIQNINKNHKIKIITYTPNKIQKLYNSNQIYSRNINNKNILD